MTIRFNTQLNAGPIEIGAAFINDFFDKGAPKPNDRNALVLELVLVGPWTALPDHFLEQASEHPEPEHAPESSSRSDPAGVPRQHTR